MKVKVLVYSTATLHQVPRPFPHQTLHCECEKKKNLITSVCMCVCVHKIWRVTLQGQGSLSCILYKHLYITVLYFSSTDCLTVIYPLQIAFLLSSCNSFAVERWHCSWSSMMWWIWNSSWKPALTSLNKYLPKIAFNHTTLHQIVLIMFVN